MSREDGTANGAEGGTQAGAARRTGMASTKRGILRTARDVLLAGLVVYVGLCAYLYFAQSGMVYYPDRELGATPKQYRLAYEDLMLPAADGVRVSAWYIPAEGAKATVLFCHGNAGNLSGRLDTIDLYHQLGANVLIFDYRGYGRSEGEPTEQGTYLDAEAAWKHLVEVRRVPPQRIVVHGRSLGASVAAHLARGRTPAGLILESACVSVPDMGAKLYPIFPVRLLCRFRYATAEYVAAARCPVLVIHSPEDELVPFEQGRRVFAAAPQPKRFVEIRGGHNEGYVASDRIYRPALRRFLDECLADPNRGGPQP